MKDNKKTKNNKIRPHRPSLSFKRINQTTPDEPHIPRLFRADQYRLRQLNIALQKEDPRKDVSAEGACQSEYTETSVLCITRPAYPESVRCTLLPGKLLAGACCTDANVLSPKHSRVVPFLSLSPGRILPVVIAGACQSDERADASVLCAVRLAYSGMRFFPLLPDGSVSDVIADGAGQSK